MSKQSEEALAEAIRRDVAENKTVRQIIFNNSIGCAKYAEITKKYNIKVNRKRIYETSNLDVAEILYKLQHTRIPRTKLREEYGVSINTLKKIERGEIAA
tara:strand:+ start:6770 stop:7069 length:300 start_codon:yes stop_codon:yes gene_type:complete